jgi:hypothetical protein
MHSSESAAGLISQIQACFRNFSLPFERSFEILPQAKSNDQGREQWKRRDREAISLAPRL